MSSRPRPVAVLSSCRRTQLAAQQRAAWLAVYVPVKPYRVDVQRMLRTMDMVIGIPPIRVYVTLTAALIPTVIRFTSTKYLIASSPRLVYSVDPKIDSCYKN